MLNIMTSNVLGQNQDIDNIAKKGINDIFLHFVATNAQNWLIGYIGHLNRHLEVGAMVFYGRVMLFYLGEMFTLLYLLQVQN